MVDFSLILCFNGVNFRHHMAFYMKHIFKNISILIALSLLITGCSIPTHQKFESAMTSYHGMSVDKLIKAWGPPRASHVNADQSKVYQWAQGGQSIHNLGASYPWIGAGTHAYGPWNHALWPAWGGGIFNTGVSMMVSRPMYLDRSCILNITTDRNNVITQHNAIGTGCAST